MSMLGGMLALGGAATSLMGGFMGGSISTPGLPKAPKLSDDLMPGPSLDELARQFRHRQERRTGLADYRIESEDQAKA